MFCPLSISSSAWAGICFRLLPAPQPASLPSPRPRALLTRNRFDPVPMPVRYLWGTKRPVRALRCVRLGLWPCDASALGGCRVVACASAAAPLWSYAHRAPCTRAYKGIPKCTASQQVCALRRPFWTVRPVQTKRHVDHYGG